MNSKYSLSLYNSWPMPFDCRGCRFRRPINSGRNGGGETTCDFCYITGEPRGCAAGKGCVRYAEFPSESYVAAVFKGKGEGFSYYAK